ncbi:MAG: MBL fold metallo-hydrolase [Armatimonadetes bacterium]|nr:MAG: MBL fold metallo-hydrolase [Armatimonadota bacterium]
MRRSFFSGGDVSGRLRVALVVVAPVLGGGLLGVLFPKDDTILTFLAVGQGDCIAFSHQGATIVIDAGPESSARRIGRLLRAEGLTQVDLILVSHPDSDHIGGLDALLTYSPRAQIAALSHFRGNAELKAELAQARKSEEDVWWIDGSAKLRVGEFRLQIEAPPLEKGDGENPGSMFVWIRGERTAALFTGDAPDQTEYQMLGRERWETDVLKAGHHGSRTSTSMAWLRETTPKYVVFSCGPENPYGHPTPEALERVRSIGAQVFRTDRGASVRFVLRGGRFVPAR